MRTAIIDDVLRRIEGRHATRAELRERDERRRNVAQLVSEIAATREDRSSGQPRREQQFG